MSAGYADISFMDLPDGVISNVLGALPVEQLLNASTVNPYPCQVPLIFLCSGRVFPSSLLPGMQLASVQCLLVQDPDRLVPSQVCKAFATMSDKLLEKLCKERRWALPRFPRGQSATTAFPWRSLYR